MQQFLEEATALSRAGKYNRRGIPTSLSGLIAASELALRYRDDIVLTSFPLPPPALQPIVFGPLPRRPSRLRLLPRGPGGDRGRAARPR